MEPLSVESIFDFINRHEMKLGVLGFGGLAGQAPGSLLPIQLLERLLYRSVLAQLEYNAKEHDFTGTYSLLVAI